MKIFIDFDDVIFNAKKFRKDLIGIFGKHGITKQEFESSYYSFGKKEEMRGKYYDPRRQIKVLKKKYVVNNERLKKDLDAFLKDLRGYIFPDVRDFLDNFEKKNLFLITYGHAQFQKKKIVNSGMSRCFNKILICRGNKVDIINDVCKKRGITPGEEDILLIDDHPEQIAEAERVRRLIKTFHMCRPQGRFSDLICLEKDYEVRNLKEVLKIIKKEGMK